MTAMLCYFCEIPVKPGDIFRVGCASAHKVQCPFRDILSRQRLFYCPFCLVRNRHAVISSIGNRRKLVSTGTVGKHHSFYGIGKMFGMDAVQNYICHQNPAFQILISCLGFDNPFQDLPLFLPPLLLTAFAFPASALFFFAFPLFFLKLLFFRSIRSYLFRLPELL